MSQQLMLSLLAVSLLCVFLLWIFWTQSFRLHRMSQKHLLHTIKAGSLSESEKESAEKQLLELLKHKPGFKLLPFVTVAGVLILASWIFYMQMGTPNYASVPNTAPEMTMEQAVADLEQRLKSEPDNLEGQMLLARSYMTMKRYGQAVETYRKASQLSKNDATILTELGEAIALRNNTGSFLGEPETYINQALTLQPNNQKALWLSGLIHFQKGDFQTTEKLWTQVLSLSENEGVKNQIQLQLDDLRAKMNGSSPSEVTQPSTLLTVSVDISDEMLNTLKPGAVLFVSIKEQNGMPMPIAAKRLVISAESSEFPLKVEFTDTDSLQAQRRLSGFDSVSVRARVSISGTATPAQGDLESAEIAASIQGESQDPTSVSVLIDRVR